MRPRSIAGLILLASCASLPGRPAAELRVLSFNIHAGKDAEQQPNLERVAELIRTAGADLVLLQEVDRRTQRANGEDHLAMLGQLTGLHTAFGKSLDYQGGDYGIAILSRFPLDSVRLVPLPVQPPQERSGTSYEPRVGLHAIVRAPARTVHVLNTHLDATAQTTYRHQELINLLAHMRRSIPEGAALIFGGDLNARPETPDLGALTFNFTDAWARCGGGGPGFTFPAHAPDRRIDYLLLRGVRCRSAEVLETRASDHRPLLITIELEGAE